MSAHTRVVARRTVLWSLVPAVLAAATVAAIFGAPGGAATNDAQASEIAKLRTKLATAERDARFWNELVQNFKPAKAMGLSSMADHRVLRLPGGPVLALHFDNMNLDRAKHLNWVALAVPGSFTKADQDRVNRLYGPGFTHFHDFQTDIHGGKPGVKGVWFVHVGARNFTSPFGKVRQGKVDPNFMPTKAPRG